MGAEVLLEAVGELAVPLARSALRAFLRTGAGMFVLALATAWTCFDIARDSTPARAWLSAMVALTICLAAGALLSMKRAVGAALLLGLQRASLGERIGAAMFERLLSLREDEAHGERGTSVARAAERIPLQAAERRLATALAPLRRPEGSWLRRTLAARVTRGVESLTLHRFRQDDAVHGGVDLVSVRSALAGRIDAELAARVQRGLDRLTFGVVAAACALALASATAIARV